MQGIATTLARRLAAPFGSTASPLRTSIAEAALLGSLDQRRFAERGYLVVPRLCDPTDLLAIRAVIAKLFRDKVGHAEGRQFDMLGIDEDAQTMRQPQIVNPSQFAPELLQTPYFRKTHSLACQLLGPDAQFSFDHSILKPARSAFATPWHQDEAHHNHRFFRYRQISFWLPLQNAPLASGCMRYVPGSHLGDVLPHRNLNNDPRIHAMECPTSEFDESLAITRPISAGACILHDGRTLHAAMPNTSAEDRFAYIIAFVGPPEPIARTSQRSVAHATTANDRRRKEWLWHGGFLTALGRRVRQGLRSPAKTLWLKVKLLLQMAQQNQRH
jgi:hypothetical protein